MSNRLQTPWGYHLIIDLKSCSKDAISSSETIVDWSRTLIPAIDMKAYGEPLVHHFATHNQRAAGYSFVQLIETSSISAHFAENIGEVYIDIFSCKEFSEEVAIKVCVDCFEAKEVNSTFIKRGL